MRCECTRCRDKHEESERLTVPGKPIAGVAVQDLVCPKCMGRNFYKLDAEGKRAKA
jgi:hypothetical protein